MVRTEPTRDLIFHTEIAAGKEAGGEGQLTREKVRGAGSKIPT